jgi:aminoglycoside phosphotransferase (APT) family kinase protein
MHDKLPAVSSPLQGGIQFTTSASRALALIGIDAARDRLGGALPRTPEELAQPAMLTSLLGTPVHDARLTGVRFDSSNCQNFLVDVVDSDGTERTLYAKLPAREFGPRMFANTVGYWKLECAFCARVAPHVSVRVPGVYAVAERGSRFVLLLENVAALPGARMFVNVDMAAGTTPDQARRCLTAFAELHATFLGLGSVEREQLLPVALHPQLAPKKAAAMKTLNRVAVKRAKTNAPEDVTPAVARTYERALDRWDALLTYWYTGPLTLVHGDSHLANCFEYATDDGPRVGLLDFQGVHWSKGIRDVAYFLIHSLDADVLATHESVLIDHYIEEMARRGVELDPERTREDYRAFSFQALMVGVVAVGLGGFTEREATVRTMLRREITAIERLDFAGWMATVS